MLFSVLGRGTNFPLSFGFGMGHHTVSVDRREGGRTDPEEVELGVLGSFKCQRAP